MNAIHQLRSVLSERCIGIAGAGGLGSNCAASLVRTGVGKIIIADFDKVEPGNLNRQFYFRHPIGMPKVYALQENLRLIDPQIQIDAHLLEVTPENIESLFSACDLIIEAFDRDIMKQWFIETALSLWPGRPLIAASGLGGWGRTGNLKVKQSGNFFLAGDGVSEVGEWMPPLAPRVGIVAHMQADIALSVLLESFEYNQ